MVKAKKLTAVASIAVVASLVLVIAMPLNMAFAGEGGPTVRVNLDTSALTLTDQPVKVYVYNSAESDRTWATQTVPPSGASVSIPITDDFIPEGNTFRVCVINEKQDSSDCKTAVREYGMSTIDVYLTVP